LSVAVAAADVAAADVAVGVADVAATAGRSKSSSDFIHSSKLQSEAEVSTRRGFSPGGDEFHSC